MKRQPTDDEIEQIALGDDNDPQELEADSAEEVDDDDPEPESEPEPERMVPISRLNEVIADRDRTQELLTQLSQVVQQKPAAQPVSRPTYVRPDDSPEKKAWREFVGETVEPVVQERITAVENQNRQVALMVFLANQESEARSMIPDYAKYASTAKAMVMSFLPSLNSIPQGVNLYVQAYHVAKSQDAARNTGRATRQTAVRRAAPAASSESRPPARASTKRTTGPISADRVKDMSLKEMEEYLNKQNARV